MFFVGNNDASFAPKGLFLGGVSAVMIAVWWMMFPLTVSVPGWLEPYVLDGDPTRRALVYFCLAVYVLRVAVTIVVFLKRKFIWIESVMVTAFMVFVLLAFARTGGANPQSIGSFEVIGLALYFGGSYLNTWSEHQRQQFKADPANEGRLYTLGLFSLSRNINYFGDTVLFSGLALVTGQVTMLVIPVAMTLNFIFFVIPRKEAYLAEKYGAEFTDFTKQTKNLIPYIY
ncbi:MAG: DUF1295 domain-containing protein [Rhodospirillales bacterium]|jgi:protein-S-isoprenylcysteine O-methyltransferase Ste14|nr:DUF1295 domain-containing protein [Rhodospirillales bacterium]